MIASGEQWSDSATHLHVLRGFFLNVLKFPTMYWKVKMFNIVAFVFEFFCNLQSYSRHILEILEISSWLLHLHNSFLLGILLDRFWTELFLLSLGYSSSLYGHIFHPFIYLFIMVPISLAISSSILIQHCSDERRLIAMASKCTHTESTSWVPIFDFLHTKTRDYGKLTHLCTALGDLLNLGNAVGETEAQWKKQHNEREL